MAEVGVPPLGVQHVFKTTKILIGGGCGGTSGLLGTPGCLHHQTGPRHHSIYLSIYIYIYIYMFY